MAVAGASQFRNAAILARTQQLPAQSNNLLASLGEVSLLDLGRANAVPGIGISSNARQLNASFLSNSASTANGLFSATIGETATIEALQTQVAALRSSLPLNALSSELRGQILDEEV